MPNVRVIDAPLNIVLHDNQRVIHDSRARHKVIKAGKRFGKTKWAIYELIQAAGLKQNGVFWYICPTFRMAKQIAWFELKTLIPPQYVRKWLESELEVELVTGSRIKLIGAENEDALRGPKLHGVIFDECAYIEEYVWPAIISGQLLGADGEQSGFAYFISSPNKRGINWFTAFHEEAKRKHMSGDTDWDAFYFTIYDNPKLNPVEIEKIHDANTDDTWNLEYLAKESALSGLWFPEFNYKDHVADVNVDGFIARGFDWGMDHPAVCLWAKVDLKNKFVYIQEEFGRQDLVISEFCEMVNARSANQEIEWNVIDPATKKRDPHTKRTDADEFSRCGIFTVPADNRARGYDIVKMFLKKNRIKIHPSCKNLILQLKNLQREDKDGDDYTDVLRYILTRVHDQTFGGNVFEIEGKFDFKPQAKEINWNDPNIFPEPKVDQNSWILSEVA